MGGEDLVMESSVLLILLSSLLIEKSTQNATSKLSGVCLSQILISLNQDVD